MLLLTHISNHYIYIHHFSGNLLYRGTVPGQRTPLVVWQRMFLFFQHNKKQAPPDTARRQMLVRLRNYPVRCLHITCTLQPAFNLTDKIWSFVSNMLNVWSRPLNTLETCLSSWTADACGTQEGVEVPKPCHKSWLCFTLYVVKHKLIRQFLNNLIIMKLMVVDIWWLFNVFFWLGYVFGQGIAHNI